MTNWNEIVAANHRLDHPDDGYSLITRPPAPADELSELNRTIGFPLLEEFVSFYREMDGFGVRTGSVEPNWFFSPLYLIRTLVEECRSGFRDTHPELATRFFPFIDWNCGDYTGYLASSDGSIMEGLFTFEHEEYTLEGDQDESEFLNFSYSSIKELLPDK